MVSRHRTAAANVGGARRCPGEAVARHSYEQNKKTDPERSVFFHLHQGMPNLISFRGCYWNVIFGTAMNGPVCCSTITKVSPWPCFPIPAGNAGIVGMVNTTFAPFLFGVAVMPEISRVET